MYLVWTGEMNTLYCISFAWYVWKFLGQKRKKFVLFFFILIFIHTWVVLIPLLISGKLAQMVVCLHIMQEEAGSMPAFSLKLLASLWGGSASVGRGVFYKSQGPWFNSWFLLATCQGVHGQDTETFPSRSINCHYYKWALVLLVFLLVGARLAVFLCFQSLCSAKRIS